MSEIAVQAILEAFMSMGGRHAFDLKDGSHYEGYIFEVRNDYLIFGSGGPLAPSEDLLISIDTIDLNTLWFWDEDKRCYLNF